MKSVYINNQIHHSLKLIASLERRALADLIEELLENALRKKADDLPSEALALLAMNGNSFEFLSDKREDVYTLTDGQAIS